MIVDCPHCKDPVIISELNCKIFRHGVHKSTGNQIDPHAPKQVCDHLITTNAIYGCGKPFRIVIEDNNLIALVCDYI